MFIIKNKKKYKSYRMTSDELRNSDGGMFCGEVNRIYDTFEDSYKMSKKYKKDIINHQLEVNYNRGFQQGIAAIYLAMKQNNINSLSSNDINKLCELAGEMRQTNFRGSNQYSYLCYSYVFTQEFKKALNIK